MTERPLLLNGPMVRATLANIKRHTRRPVAVGELGALALEQLTSPPEMSVHDGKVRALWNATDTLNIHADCPHGKPGDQLWVRETWALRRYNIENFGQAYPGPAANAWSLKHNCVEWGLDLVHRASTDWEPSDTKYTDGSRGKWRPSIHMPRWASRIDLKVTSVRVERVQNIDDDGARAEGVDEIGETIWCTTCPRSKKPAGRSAPMESANGYCDYGCPDYDKEPRASSLWPGESRRDFGFGLAGTFAELWDSIYAKRGTGWDANPWVWVTEFERVQ